ncbi:glycosyltransferase family protein [Actinokineospora spheciospongiae]|uniref:glycosyltransferase n=1 Tax=Actinokineospora spheciospongiae TaxID=909613 RepID=UPI000D71CF89|nr:glycosyltransferase [Actinokineospora spheciospongiae]PWW66852.1 glycosyl transferase family 4 [Actinokineospora spheciospongiae]
MPVPSPAIRVASVPSGHVYVRHLSPVEDGGVVHRLPAPPVPGAPEGQWWPSPLLEGSWVDAHAAEFDLYHLHFGFDDRTPAQLRDLVAALRRARRPLVLTVHDLRNPHHPDPAPHAAALDVLVPAADAVVTLTPGAAARIAERWGRTPEVVAHPHVVPLELLAGTRERGPGFVVGLHAKSKRANSDPVPVARALAAAVAALPGAHLRVDAHDDAGGRAVAAALPDLDVRVHPPFSDEELWEYLRGLDVSVLPYRFGTHSGWLEACHDLGTTVVAPSCGFYAEQAPCLSYGMDEDGFDAESLHAAVRRAYHERPVWQARHADRLRQRREVADAHEAVYRAALRGVRQEVGV